MKNLRLIRPKRTPLKKADMLFPLRVASRHAGSRVYEVLASPNWLDPPSRVRKSSLSNKGSGNLVKETVFIR